jgi:hypothetical protein
MIDGWEMRKEEVRSIIRKDKNGMENIIERLV